ncbi:MAG: D-2-hydroxyacid dehydrogenase [Clostridia bacterium]|nr:D-2-hydroxyacid dehydrogenase [Clostridia bacterium]
MQIVILDGYAVNPGDLSWDAIQRFGTLSVYDRTPPDCTAQRMRGADVVFTNKTRIGYAELAQAKNLQFIGVLGTGYDVIDLSAVKRAGVTVSNVPGYSSDAVAQHTMALLLEICNQVGHHSREVRKGRWTHAADYCFWDYPLLELAGQTFGVLGTGRIGCAAARLAAAFGMRVIGHSPHRRKEFCGEYVGFPELLAMSDVLSLHCPVTAETTGCINADTLLNMKPTAILLNTSRGALVNAQDLADALNEGRLYAAGVDVAEREPIPRSNPLLSAKNCVITPHIAWAPLAARRRLIDMSAANLAAFLEGAPINRVG